MGLELPKELEAFVEERIGGGGYTNAGDVLRTAFGLLEERERLLDKIDAGTAQFSSGQFTEYDDDSFEWFFADIERQNCATIMSCPSSTRSDFTTRLRAPGNPLP